ncbi:MAG: enoyl-CoA hydratase-related protein [Myxococcota bacterium]
MSDNPVRSEREGPVLTLVIDRPKALNALNPETFDALEDQLSQLGDARALVLTGGGDKAFVAGADIKRMAAMSLDEGLAFARRGQDLFDRLERLSVPVIAAVNGFALGGGCELAMACDFILASERARFGQPEVSIGVIPGFGGTVRLGQRVGPAWARRMMMTGEQVDAELALQIGLATELVPAAELRGRAQSLGEQIAKNAPKAVAWAKESCLHAQGDSHEGALTFERNAFGLCFCTEDQKEGMTAFLEKRRPSWRGA